MVRLPVSDASSLGVSRFGEAVSRAGAAFGGAIEQIHREKAAAERQKIEDAQRDRALDIQEQRAQAALLKEQGTLAQGAAVKQDALERLDRMADANTKDAYADGVRKSLASPGGALGPFGVFSRAAQGGVQAAADAQQEMAGKTALAQQMTGPAAQAFLTREAADMKRRALVRGYQEEGQAVQNALQDGVFEDPASMFERASSGKTPKEVPPSAQAQAQAKQYAEALQSAIAEGRSPGDVHARLAHQYDIHRQIVQRAKSWPVADTKAGEFIDTLRGILAETPSGIDPKTGTDAHADLRERLAQMDGEWARTQYQTFRVAHDPGDSISGLQKVLFSATAKSAPDAFMAQDAAVRADQQLPKTNADVVQAAAGANSRASGLDGSAVPRGTPAARKTDTGERASEEQIAAAAPARAAERERRGFKSQSDAKPNATRADGARQIKSIVAAEVQRGMASGADKRDRIKAMWKRIVDTTGLDPRDPAVHSLVREALSQEIEGKKR